MGQSTILCVDDEQNILNSLRRLFRREQYNVLTALSGQEGLELLQNNPVDIIISDQRMPGMTGVQFLCEAKKISPSTIRIILSGYTDFDSITAAINEGNAYKFILKPWNDEELKATIKKTLEQYGSSEATQTCHAQKPTNQEQELKTSNKELERKVRGKKEELSLSIQALLSFQDILENLPMAIIVMSEEKCITFANKRAQEIYGKKIGTSKESDISKLFSDKISSLIQEVIKTNQPAKLNQIPHEDRVLNIECIPMKSKSKEGNILMVINEVGKN